MSGPVQALMWEVRAHEYRLDDLLSWVREHAVTALDAGGGRDLAVYRSEEERVVIIAHFEEDQDPVILPEPPEHLVARPAHQWPFHRVL